MENGSVTTFKIGSRSEIKIDLKKVRAMASFDPVNFELGLSRFLLFKLDNGGKVKSNLQSDYYEEQNSLCG